MHDLAIKVDYPDDLLTFSHHLLAEMQQPLTRVMHQLIILKYFRQFMDLDIAYPINYHCMFMLVLAANSMLVDVFDFIDLDCVEVVLHGEVRT